MRAAILRELLTIQQPVRYEDATGDAYPEWEDLDIDVPAGVEERAAGEQDEASQQIHRTTYVVTLRYRDDITHDMRLIYRGRILNISSVTNVKQRDRELQLIATDSGQVAPTGTEGSDG